MGFAALDTQNRAANGQVEAARTGAAWVQEKNGPAAFDRRLVGVSGEHHGYSCRVGIEVEVFYGVDHVDQAAPELDGLGGGEIGARAVRVDVAAYRCDGGDAGELGEDLRVANVAGVKDVGDPMEGNENLGAEEAVSVGDDADAGDGRVRHARVPRAAGCGDRGSRGGRRR